jgi:hypothetical protein
MPKSKKCPEMVIEKKELVVVTIANLWGDFPESDVFD